MRNTKNKNAWTTREASKIISWNDFELELLYVNNSEVGSKNGEEFNYILRYIPNDSSENDICLEAPVCCDDFEKFKDEIKEQLDRMLNSLQKIIPQIDSLKKPVGA